VRSGVFVIQNACDSSALEDTGIAGKSLIRQQNLSELMSGKQNRSRHS